MTVTAVLGTRDELDVLPRCVAQLRSIGVDAIIVFDVGSTDGTVDWLREQESRGDLWHVDGLGGTTPEVRAAARRSLLMSVDTDWLIFLDSDEFWLPRGADLETALEAEEADIIGVPRYNVVLGPDGPTWPPGSGPLDGRATSVYAVQEAHAYERITADPTYPYIRADLEPKVAIRSRAFAGVEQGSHYALRADTGGARTAVTNGVVIAHVPFRTLERYEQRARNVAASVSRDPQRFSGGRAWQWEIAARESASGTTDAGFERQRIDAGELERLRRAGFVRTAAEILEELVPAFPTVEDEAAAMRGAQPWSTLAAIVARRHGIDPAGKSVLLSHRHGPTVRVGGTHVVRLFSDRLDGRSRREHALRMHGLLAGRDVGASELVASGTAAGDLTYLIETVIPGVPWARVAHRVSDLARLDVATWLGRWVARLQSIEPRPGGPGPEGADLVDELRRRRAAFLARATTIRHVPPTFTASLRTWLPTAEAMLRAPGRAVLSHGALDAAHLHVQPAPAGGAVDPIGVAGLTAMGWRHPLWDLGAVWSTILAHDPRATGRFMEAADLPARDATGFAATALAWSLVLSPADAGQLPPIGDGETPDDVAERWFGAPDRPRGRVEIGAAHA